MKTKSFDTYLQKRLEKKEISKIEKEVNKEVYDLLLKTNNIPNKKTRKVLDDSDKGIGLISCKDKEDFYKQLEIEYNYEQTH